MALQVWLRNSAASALILIGATAAADAATVSYTATTGPTYQSANAFPTSLNIQKFDTTLGTLNSATLTMGLDVLATINVNNFSGLAQVLISASSSTPFTISLASPVLSLGATAAATVLGVPLPLATGLNTYAGIPTTASNFLPLSGLQQAAFSGVGLNFLALTISNPNPTGVSGIATGDNIFYNGSATAILNLQIDYDYNSAAPEPASMALLGVSLAGLAALRRRRQK